MKNSNLFRNQTEVSKNKLYTPQLNVAGNLHYNKKLCQRLWAILYRASNAAREYKTNMIETGKNSKVCIKGKAKGESKITFVIYHVPIKGSENNIIESFDVRKMDFTKLNHSKVLTFG